MPQNSGKDSSSATFSSVQCVISLYYYCLFAISVPRYNPETTAPLHHIIYIYLFNNVYIVVQLGCSWGAWGAVGVQLMGGVQMSAPYDCVMLSGG